MSELAISQERHILKPNTMTFDERKQQLIQQDEQERQAIEQARKSPFKSFIQLNKEFYKQEDWLMGKSPLAYRIFRFLIEHMDDFNAVMCSYKVMQEQFDVSAESVRRAIKILKDNKFLDIYKSGSSNVYSLNKNIVWNSWGTNHKYAKFGANIILAESEQPKKKTKSEKVKQVKIKEN